MPYLAITTQIGFEKEWQFHNVDILTIGRAPTNDIVLPDEKTKVSRYHACLVRSQPGGDRYFVRDLGSLHLTKVGGKPITQHCLTNGEVIEIGPYQLIYTEGATHHPASLREEDDLLDIVDENATGGVSGEFRRAQGQTTKPVVPSQLLEGVTLTALQQEFFAEFIRMANLMAGLADLFAAAMAPLAKVFSASSGFVGLLASETAKGYRSLGVYGLDPKKGERLRITSRTFLDDIRKGKPIVEAKAVLVPIYSQDRVAGFICLGWATRTAPISKSEVEALCILGRLTSVVTIQRQPQAGVVNAPAQIGPALPWPPTLVGRSAHVQTLRTELLAAAGTDDNVLLFGLTGAGKEVAATTIHHHSVYKQGPFLGVNCSTFSETLAESQLFGYAPRSGIAGADPNGKPGFFELAEGGVLFLDEIHTLSRELQAKLLRALQEKEIWRLGSKVPVQVHVKVVAATNEDLQCLMDRGTFRSDLYFRFGRRVRIPSLAERPEDVPLLVHYFLDIFAHEDKRPPMSVSRQTLQRLVSYKWPGNIRELRECVKQVVGLKKDIWFSWDLPEALLGNTSTGNEKIGRPKSMREVEKSHIMEVLTFTRGNKSEAAKILGFQSRQTLLNKMDEYRIPREYSGTFDGNPTVTHESLA